jgi:hypothetical protein
MAKLPELDADISGAVSEARFRQPHSIHQKWDWSS